MATTFKTFLNNDTISTRTLLHEAIPVTGSILSGTYGTYLAAQGSEPNIKSYSHGMFQSVYDYPYLSSSANHLMDITVGISGDSSNPSALSASTPGTHQAKKINIYNTMAQILMGHDKDGNIQQFDKDGDIAAGGTKLKECIFFNFSRLLIKDEIKKGSFNLELGVSGAYSSSFNGYRILIQDTGSTNTFYVNTPVGEYGILSAKNVTSVTEKSLQEASDNPKACGLLFYQAGIAVLTSSVFQSVSRRAAGTAYAIPTNGPNQFLKIVAHGANGFQAGPRMLTGNAGMGTSDINDVLTGSTIDVCATAIRHRIYNLSFNNTTELNSTIYFCRANHNEFNYSSNPTYLNSSKIRVKSVTTDQPVSYITTIGLYSSDNELLAVAKLSEPLKKDPSTELTLRVRLDY